MNLTVTDHHHDQDAGVYRLALGQPVEHVKPMTDAEGRVLLDDDGEPMMESWTEHVPVGDFVFAADDERWQGKDSEQVAQEQRGLVRAALEERERAAQAAARREEARVALPGAGDPL